MRTLAVVGLLIALPASALAGEPAGLTVKTVDGYAVVDGKVRQPLSGKVTVRGNASVPAPDGQDPAAKPLVADAGDSPWVAAGTPATLLGAGFGGKAPYRFAWTSSAGPIAGADAPTAQLDTTGLAPGIYQARLTITDAAGATAQDTVKVVVASVSEETLLDETREAATPGAVSAGPDGTVRYDFQAPPGVLSMVASIHWTNENNDFDLEVEGPDGSVYSGEGDFIPDDVETANIPQPVPGAWTVVAHKFATTPDQVTARVVAQISQDPRPAVDAGGPYTFLTTETIRLDGTVSGGAAPVTVGWDTDEDGRIDASGTDVTLQLPQGRRLVTLMATDANGLERRQMTSVVVTTRELLSTQTTPITVVGIADTGINPYHLEFSAQTYPDPDVLALTRNFTRHPSEYITGYPADAKAIPVTLGQGYFPAQDEPFWDGNQTIKAGDLYWIPGTKIVGAVDAGGSTGGNAAADAHPILDDDGHGSGSASVSTGNRYGYCPTCLLLVVEALDESVANRYPWVDISSNSFGYIGGIPGWAINGTGFSSRDATERGQTVLFAAGNGIGNAFDVPQITYVSDRTGGDWNIVVGAIRRDNQRAVVGDGITVHISGWGDGNLPSACRTGTVGQCAFGGTSAATPYTAGVFGTVLTEVRRAVGDGQAGQKPGQVVARGVPIATSDALTDGKLTRSELREAVLKTALPLNTENDPSPFPYPLTAPYADHSNVLFEGYGAATPESAERAIDVLLGRVPMPDRSYEDSFFAIDRALRDTLWGAYDRDGDGNRDFKGVADLGITPEDIADANGAMVALRRTARQLDVQASQTLGQNAMVMYLHRVVEAEPDSTVTCGADFNELSMDESDSDGDVEPCYESRITSVPAAYRPIGIWPARRDLDAPLPAGSTVSVTLYVAQENPTVLRPTGVLMATDRVIGRGDGRPLPVVGSGTGPGSNANGTPLPDSGGCVAMGELCWTKFDWSFDTSRPAFTGEPLTFQVEMIGSRAFAFGYEGRHASRVVIDPAQMPASGLDFGVTIAEPSSGASLREAQTVVAGGTVTFPELGEDPTGAGDHPTTRRVQVSVDDAAFTAPIKATLDEASGTWSASLGQLSRGSHTLYVRALRDTTRSAVASTTFTVSHGAVVQWQVTRRNAAVSGDAWRPATGFKPWTFEFGTRRYGTGAFTIHVRVVRDGLVLAQRAVQTTFR